MAYGSEEFMVKSDAGEDSAYVNKRLCYECEVAASRIPAKFVT